MINLKLNYTFNKSVTIDSVLIPYAKHPEIFIKHYREEYSTPVNPPSWMCIELLTIGQLSRLFTALKDNSDKEAIALFFGLHHSTFTSWLHIIP